MTLATIAAIENRSVPQNIAVTGKILSDSSIGRVGGILEKAEAAGQNNLNVLHSGRTGTDNLLHTENRQGGYLPRSVSTRSRIHSKNILSQQLYTEQIQYGHKRGFQYR
jgi:predicted S18 family serine protease